MHQQTETLLKSQTNKFKYCRAISTQHIARHAVDAGCLTTCEEYAEVYRGKTSRLAYRRQGSTMSTARHRDRLA